MLHFLLVACAVRRSPLSEWTAKRESALRRAIMRQCCSPMAEALYRCRESAWRVSRADSSFAWESTSRVRIGRDVNHDCSGSINFEGARVRRRVFDDDRESHKCRYKSLEPVLDLGARAGNSREMLDTCAA